MDTVTSLDQQLDDIIKCRTPTEASEKFIACLNNIPFTNDDVFSQKIKRVAEAITTDNVVYFSAQKFADDLISFLAAKIQDNSFSVTVFKSLLAILMRRSSAFEKHIFDLRELIANRLIASGQCTAAASMLQELTDEHFQRPVSDSMKFKVYIQMTEIYLDLFDRANAEQSLNRAVLLIDNIADETVIFRQKLVHARLLEAKHRFVEAGQKFVEFSLRRVGPSDAERHAFLQRAVASVMLSSTGSSRNRLLASLAKDERCRALDAYPVVEKMYLGRLIKRNEVDSLTPMMKSFYAYLDQTPPDISSMDTSSPPSEIASKTSASTTEASIPTYQKLLNRSFIEHNVLACGSLYENVSLTSLADLLGIQPDEAEKIAAEMISENRLVGHIDQIDGYVHFKRQDPALSAWSDRIESVLTSVNRIFDDITTVHPDWSREQLLKAKAGTNPLAQPASSSSGSGKVKA